MANLCSTSYVFEGNKEEIADLYNKLQSLEKCENPVENGFGHLWLGYVVRLFGGDWNQIDCRGQIVRMEQTTDTTINLLTSTAWKDMPEVWDLACQYLSIKYYFMAQEAENNYYVTNDSEGKYFPERFQIAECNNDPEYYETIEEVFADISEMLNVPITTREAMNAALEVYNEENEDRVSVNEFEVIIKELSV